MFSCSHAQTHTHIGAHTCVTLLYACSHMHTRAHSHTPHTHACVHTAASIGPLQDPQDPLDPAGVLAPGVPAPTAQMPSASTSNSYHHQQQQQQQQQQPSPAGPSQASHASDHPAPNSTSHARGSTSSPTSPSHSSPQAPAPITLTGRRAAGPAAAASPGPWAVAPGSLHGNHHQQQQQQQQQQEVGSSAQGEGCGSQAGVPRGWGGVAMQAGRASAPAALGEALSTYEGGGLLDLARLPLQQHRLDHHASGDGSEVSM